MQNIDIHQLITSLNKGQNSPHVDSISNPETLLEDAETEEFFYSDSRLYNIYFHKNDYTKPSAMTDNEPCLVAMKGSKERGGVSFYFDMDILFECIKINTIGKKNYNIYAILSRYLINQLNASLGEKIYPDIESPDHGSHI